MRIKFARGTPLRQRSGPAPQNDKYTRLFLLLLALCVVLAVSQVVHSLVTCDTAFGRQMAIVVKEPIKQQSPTRDQEIIPLRQLVNTKVETVCPNGLFLVNDTVLEPELAFDLGRRRIPRIIHITSKTRCMPIEFAENLDKWRFPDHSFFFHNEAAIERLILRNWPEFPQLQQALRCTKGGAAKADIWRALVLYEYGGIYTDIDNAPAKFNGATITDGDDAFFVMERSGILSQYFMASRPRHPLMYLLVQQMMKRLLSLNDVSMQIVSYTTGPGALRIAFNNFMNGQGPNAPYEKPLSKYWYPKAKVYTGMYNFTVRVVGDAEESDEWVARDIIPDKHLIYKRMNMTYFRELPKVETNIGCFQRLYEEEGHFERYFGGAAGSAPVMIRYD